MAVTVSGKNFTQFSTCDSGSAGGTWSGSPTQDTDNYKEGSASISDILKGSGNNDWTFTPTSSIDLSGTKHLRLWVLLTQGSLINTKASGGIQIGLTDGTNTGYYYVDGRDTYPGGWHCLVLDVSRAVDAGTKPTSMNAITVVTLRINLTAGGKNVDNTWVDNLSVSDGLVAYGDDSGSYFDLEDIFSVEDTPTSGGWGVMTKYKGQYFMTGDLDIGFATSATKFNAKNSVLIFEDRGTNINSNLLTITAIDSGNASYTTEFILGAKSGTSGVEGCAIRSESLTQNSLFKLDFSDTDLDNVKLYGTSFFGSGTVTLPAYASAANEVLNCEFNTCGVVTVSSCTVTNCNFIKPTSYGIVLSSTTHYVTKCNFISPTNASIDITATGSFAMNQVVSSGTDGSANYDVRNTNASSNEDSNANGGSTYNLNNTNTGFGQSFTGGGNVLTNVVLNLKKSNSPTGTAYVKIYAHSGTFGTSSVPTGAALATSEGLDVSTLTGSFVATKFDFLGAANQITLTNAVKYVVTIEYSNGDATNTVDVEYDASNNHGGNSCTYTGSWTANSGTDLEFYVRVGGLVILNLTNGASMNYENNTGSPAGVTDFVASVNVTITNAVTSPSTKIYMWATAAPLGNGVAIIGPEQITADPYVKSVPYTSNQPFTMNLTNASSTPKYTPLQISGTITGDGYSRRVSQVQEGT